MESPSCIIWRTHGAPSYDCEPHDGRCWMCAGEMSRGTPVDKFNGASFTGQNKVRLPNATHVCEPCIFVCSRIAPVLGDRQRGQEVRRFVPKLLAPMGGRLEVSGVRSRRVRCHVGACRARLRERE